MPDSDAPPLDPAVAIIVGSVRRALGQPAPAPSPAQVATLAPRLASLAMAHRLGGCLMADPDVGPYLNQKSTDRSRDRTISLLLEISRILERLSQAGVPAIPLKGPLLTARLVGNPALREAHDIDILTRPEYLDQAQAALAPEYLPDSDTRRERARREHHELMKPVAGGRMVELHWRLLSPVTGAVIRETEPWETASLRTAAGISHMTLDPATEIVVICAHAAHHFGFRLHWMSDVAALMLKADSAAWEAALEIAGRWRVRTAMLTALMAAGRIFGLSEELPLQADIIRRGNHRIAGWIARRVLSGATGQPSQFAMWPRRLGLFDSSAQMVKTTANILFTPIPEDRASAGLPQWAEPLTGVLRPIFVLQRALRRR